MEPVRKKLRTAERPAHPHSPFATRIQTKGVLKFNRNSSFSFEVPMTTNGADKDDHADEGYASASTKSSLNSTGMSSGIDTSNKASSLNDSGSQGSKEDNERQEEEESEYDNDEHDCDYDFNFESEIPLPNHISPYNPCLWGSLSSIEPGAKVLSDPFAADRARGTRLIKVDEDIDPLAPNPPTRFRVRLPAGEEDKKMQDWLDWRVNRRQTRSTSSFVFHGAKTQEDKNKVKKRFSIKPFYQR